MSPLLGLAIGVGQYPQETWCGQAFLGVGIAAGQKIYLTRIGTKVVRGTTGAGGKDLCDIWLGPFLETNDPSIW